MPTKSNNMSPMPMQPKIGEASLKFGPDWLRALSSSETPGNPSNSSSGGDTGGRHGFAFSGWGGGGTPEGRTGFSSNNKEFSASSQFSSSPSYHQQHHQIREGKGSTPPNSLATRFKLSEHRYSREEMLALYDKNLEAPSFLANFGTLIIEKMQPPMAFSQPLEEEIRIWHSPQPESSRQGSGAAPVGRGFAIRGGRGGGIERGRGRGRGGYYGRPHEDEERGSFSRPRGFERSQSVHERAPWGERNGLGGPPGSGPVNPEETRGGGSWRTRESFGGRRHDENDDGWRKPRWRRGEEEEEGHRNSSSSRRLHRSWSEDENHDNIPEWAKDNPVEESGTFDSSGAFHGEDRISKIRDFDRKPENDSSMKSRVESEPSGSHNDRVQKRNPDRNDSVKPVIPAPVREEMENQSEKNDFSSSTNRSKERPDQYSAPQHPTGHSIILKKEMEVKNDDSERLGEKQHHGHVGILESQHPQKQHITNVQHQMTASHESRTQLTHSQQSVVERNTSVIQQQQSRIDMRASSSSHDMGNLPPVHNRHSEEDHYRSMTVEAMNLVSKLIEDDGSGSRTTSATGQHGLRLPGGVIPQQLLSGVNVNANTNSLTNNVAMNDLSRNQGNVPNIPVANIPPNVLAPVPVPSPGSLDVWFYRDPQGSVQGPFNTHEMAQWYSQGYFSGKLLLRRECDKVFITLAEMGKLYGRNPFAVHPDSPPPPPLQDPNASALEFPRENSNVQAQLQQRQQQLIQQNLLREQQQQFMINSLGHGGARKDEPAWQGPNIPQVSQPARPGPTPSSLTTEQIQNQLLMNMAKSQGLNMERDSNAIDQLQALFHRQMQMKNNSGETMMSQQNQKNDFGDIIPSRHNASMEVSKSPVAPSDPIQSLVQQLTSMANTQHQLQQHKVNATNKPDVGSPWGAPPSANSGQPPVQQGQWGSHPNSAPWGYGEQNVMKLQQEEELRRRKEEEEAERKRLDDDERKRVEEHKRHERKRLEEQQRLEEEKQRKLREEQYLHQKQQEELMKQQQEVELARQNELSRQKEMLMQRQIEQQRQLEQQRQMRDEQTRLAEENQARLEEQRLENERKEKIQTEREQKLRQERERQEQAKIQQFSWNAATQPQAPIVNSKTLLEIQQEEAVKQEKETVIKKKQQQEQLRIQQQQQAQQQKSINLKWAQSVVPQAKVAIKSLTEIQAEEQAKLQKAQDKEREKRQVTQAQQHQQQAWSAQLTWANRASINAANAAAAKSNGGVWDESSSSMAAKVKSSSNNQSVSSNNRTQQSSSGKKTKELSDESFMKLFAVQGQDGPMPKGPRQKQQMSSPMNNIQDDFTRWCFDKVQAIGGGSVDIPTFVGFLKEVESPYEVGDYVRSYLGDGKEARDFSREFLERRSRWKNARKDGGGSFEDNLCRPASAVNPNQNDFQEVKAKGKKTKKGKMQKVDSRILGFSTSAATDRLNVGNRDYGDGTTD